MYLVFGSHSLAPWRLIHHHHSHWLPSIVDTLVPIACNRLPPVAWLDPLPSRTTVPNSLLWSPQRQTRF
jgi:hypothetical protein